MSSETTPIDPKSIEYARPADKIKTVDVDPIPKHIFDEMKKYEDSARGFGVVAWEYHGSVDDPHHIPHAPKILVRHRPEDAQVNQIYRMPSDPASQEIERLTYFDVGSGRTIAYFEPILGEDWRGVWRGGGTLIVMDLDGNEMFQLWRYWEDSLCKDHIPKLPGELDNSPGIGRIERLTNDEFKYSNLVMSRSDKIFALSSNKLNNRDTLIYISHLIDSKTQNTLDSEFNLPMTLITPPPAEGSPTARWTVDSFSVDDHYLLVTLAISAVHRPLYIVDLSGPEPGKPELITLPNTTEKEDMISNSHINFSRDHNNPHVVYFVTTAYGDFRSVISYDIPTKTVTHITAIAPSLRALRPIPWDTKSLTTTKDFVLFSMNVEGWTELFLIPLTGPHKNTVLDVRLQNWEGGSVGWSTNARNGKSTEVVLPYTTYKSPASLAFADLAPALQNVQKDSNGKLFIEVGVAKYRQATAIAPAFRTVPPELIRFKSFDGLDVPAMYYHPGGEGPVPVVISIHGGPESQSTSESRIPIHGYLLNELHCAVIYPNVRGSNGYGKTYLSLDDWEKREDSVKDIGSLIDHIEANMKDQLDAKRIAVMGGSYGGYMVYACLTHFSSKLACGVANFGIAHWPSFLRNTADHRRDARRQKYGDERIPRIGEFLERISPLNNAEKISVPLSICHGENDSRVTVEEAIRMYDIVKRQGVHVELVVCEMEGHGFKQKSVIEYTNAAKIQFIQRFLFGKHDGRL